MNTAQTDLQQLRIKHILYKSKVRAALYGGTYDPEFFSVNGPVNVWFETIGKVKYWQEPEIKELLLVQNELNTLVKYLTDLYSNGKIDQALENLNRVDIQSEKFVELVTKLEARFSM